MGRTRGGPGEVEFVTFVREHGRRLRRAGYLLTGSWTSADDLVQTAFERTWPRWHVLATDVRRLAYLERVIFTSFVRASRRR